MESKKKKCKPTTFRKFHLVEFYCCWLHSNVKSKHHTRCKKSTWPIVNERERDPWIVIITDNLSVPHIVIVWNEMPYGWPAARERRRESKKQNARVYKYKYDTKYTIYLSISTWLGHTKEARLYIVRVMLTQMTRQQENEYKTI